MGKKQKSNNLKYNGEENVWAQERIRSKWLKGTA
jgi:hypothetical protein